MTRNQQLKLHQARDQTHRHRRRVRRVSRVLLGLASATWIGQVLIRGAAPVPFALSTAWLAIALALAVLHSTEGRQHISLVATFTKALRHETLRVRNLVLRLRRMHSPEQREQSAQRPRAPARTVPNQLPADRRSRAMERLSR